MKFSEFMRESLKRYPDKVLGVNATKVLSYVMSIAIDCFIDKKYRGFIRIVSIEKLAEKFKNIVELFEHQHIKLEIVKDSYGLRNYTGDELKPFKTYLIKIKRK